jgi:cytochrome b6-f complex iron-sulfur subunit
MKSMNRREFVVLTTGAICAGAIAGCAGRGQWTGPTTFDVGTAADLKPGVDGRWEERGGFYLVREGARAFAVSSTCTHKGCDVAQGGPGYACDCHGSQFTVEGKVLKGPATRSLERFGISVDAAGHVVVDRTKVYEEARWGEAGAFVAV